MTAQDYPVWFPYGAKTDPYTPQHPHLGDDRKCPMGTPLLVGGQLIGLTGNSGSYQGQAYDPHLHVQEWQGSVYDTRKPQNAFQPGTVVGFSKDPNQEWGKHITIQNKDGWNTTYCHLSEINVQVGQKLGEAMLDASHQSALFAAFLGRLPTVEEVSRDVGKITIETMINQLDQSSEYADKKQRDNAAYATAGGQVNVTVNGTPYVPKEG